MNPLDTTIYLNKVGISCNLGSNAQEVSSRLFSATNRDELLTVTDQYSPKRTLPLGLIKHPLHDTEIHAENSRNNRILAQALHPLIESVAKLKNQYGPHRIGIVLGTSTSGIAEGEAALQGGGDTWQLADGYHYSTQELSAPSRFAAQWLGITGPRYALSSACTSGGKALCSAARLLKLGACDAVIAGGVDTLCRMTVEGFSALGVTSDAPCLPFSLNRSGINIGEAAAVFVLSREPGPVTIAGYGETSDAHHISSPEPQGLGAEAAMRMALQRAGLEPHHIDYLNLHGTATAQNDSMEASAVSRVFGPYLPCSSTKALTGHTLAAAGALEAAFCYLSLINNRVPPHIWDDQPDPELPMLAGLGSTPKRPVRLAMSNSFAFGGNNLSLILGTTPYHLASRDSHG